LNRGGNPASGYLRARRQESAHMANIRHSCESRNPAQYRARYAHIAEPGGVRLPSKEREARALFTGFPPAREWRKRAAAGIEPLRITPPLRGSRQDEGASPKSRRWGGTSQAPPSPLQSPRLDTSPLSCKGMPNYAAHKGIRGGLQGAREKINSGRKIAVNENKAVMNPFVAYPPLLIFASPPDS